jgi:Glycosyltransferase family 87
VTRSEPGPDRAVRAMRGLTLALGGVLVLLSLWVVIQRFHYPVDGEWMTGAVRDGVERLRDGQQLYVAPSARFIPFVYPPLYFWVCSLVAHVCSTFVACKLVSIAATLATGWGIFRISRTLGATPFWSGIALLLHVATYSLTIFFYDLERVDAFYAAIIVVGLAVLLARDSLASTLLGGVLLGLAFFAKQAGLLAFGAVVVGLLLARERRRALIVGLTGVVVLVAVGVYLDVKTGGWFRYYCLKLPSAHGLRAERLSMFFITDVPKAFAITAGSVAVSVPVLWSFARHRRRPAGATSQDVLFGAVIAAAMAASFSFRAHAGGWPNVLVAWLPLGCAAAAVAATRAEEAAKGTSVARLTSFLLLGGVSLQLLGAMFDPLELAPNREDLAERERFLALIRTLEERGEVIVTTAGNITKPSSVHAAALYDIVRAGDHAPADLLEGLAQRRYAAVFLGLPDEYDCGLATCNELSSAIVRNYFVAGRRHERDRTGTSGYDARPRWLLRPRKQPLDVALTTQELLDRQRIEKGFAEMKSAESPMDTEITASDEIEELTARELANRSR